jgi:Z1 domain
MSTNTSTLHHTETVDLKSVNATASQKWLPEAHEETFDLITNLGLPDPASENRITEEARTILGKCLPPKIAQGSETGLVVGYVQSGKTMSFTTVTALAKDNGYPIIVVIAGTSIPLFKQSEERLIKDLRLHQRDDRKWKHLSKPTLSDKQSVESALLEWKDPTIKERERQTVLITVMKHHKHLSNLNKLLSSLDIRHVPVLVIDDEADQAGLNNLVNKGGQSSTYFQIVELRRLLPHHSYLQYTATPQAPLLINIIDILSPSFTQVLIPGEAYTGGKDFFKGDVPLVEVIPSDEIPSKDNVLHAPPESLLRAMRLFYLGVAVAHVEASATGSKPKGNRSMMVHPSQKTMPHSEYAHWVRTVKKNWEQLINRSASDQARIELVDEFRDPYNDLARTVTDLPPFDDVVKKLPVALQKTIIKEVNSKQKDGTPQIDWRNDFSHILVGGQAMDRGFTVEGLTITYMPRTKGVGNADTVQQRARFFGYKRNYLGYCRVFIEDEVARAFVAYVDHEEDIRERLILHSKTGKPLSEWKRAFFLEKNLKATRSSVLSLSYLQSTFSDKWFNPDVPHATPEAVQVNRTSTSNFLKHLTFTSDVGHPQRTESQRHGVARGISLEKMYKELLASLRIPHPTDSQKFTGLLLQVARYLDDHKDAHCTVFHMSEGKVRERSVDEKGKIPTLFQGAHPNSRGLIYKGDGNIRDDDVLTIQIHNVTVLDRDKKTVLMRDVPVIAIWVPKSMAKGWLSQEAPPVTDEGHA